MVRCNRRLQLNFFLGLSFVGREERGGRGLLVFFSSLFILWMNVLFFLGVICFEGAYLEGGVD